MRKQFFFVCDTPLRPISGLCWGTPLFILFAFLRSDTASLHTGLNQYGSLGKQNRQFPSWRSHPPSGLTRKCWTCPTTRLPPDYLVSSVAKKVVCLVTFSLAIRWSHAKGGSHRGINKPRANCLMKAYEDACSLVNALTAFITDRIYLTLVTTAQTRETGFTQSAWSGLYFKLQKSHRIGQWISFIHFHPIYQRIWPLLRLCMRGALDIWDPHWCGCFSTVRCLDRHQSLLRAQT